MAASQLREKAVRPSLRPKERRVRRAKGPMLLLVERDRRPPQRRHRVVHRRRVADPRQVRRAIPKLRAASLVAKHPQASLPLPLPPSHPRRRLAAAERPAARLRHHRPRRPRPRAVRDRRRARAAAHRAAPRPPRQAPAEAAAPRQPGDRPHARVAERRRAFANLRPSPIRNRKTPPNPSDKDPGTNEQRRRGGASRA